MSLSLEKAAFFRDDFALGALWYVRQAGENVARRYQEAVDSTLNLLCRQPDLGRIRHFRHPQLRGVRSYGVQAPFYRLLIFYRVNAEILQAVRLMHGARELPRRLVEAPGSPED